MRSALVRRPFIFDTEDTTEVVRFDIEGGLAYFARHNADRVPFTPKDLRALAGMLVEAAGEIEQGAKADVEKPATGAFGGARVGSIIRITKDDADASGLPLGCEREVTRLAQMWGESVVYVKAGPGHSAERAVGQNGEVYLRPASFVVVGPASAL